MKPVLLLLCGLALLGCDSGVAGPPFTPSPRTVPLSLRMLGTAEGSDAEGRTASCTLELILELSEDSERTADAVAYTGKIGGAVQRTILDSNGDGISLWPHMHGEAEVHLFDADSVAFITPINLDADDSRFYHELGYLPGTIDEQGFGSGTWVCAPFDITEGGWVDSTLVAPGTWHVEPQPGTP